MKKRNDQNVIVKRAVLVFILMFLVLLAALAFFTRRIVMREQLKASYTAETTVANVESQLNRYLAESELLKSIVESGYEISDSDFAALSKLMYNEDGIIKAVELAPNGVVRSVYPRAGNADALGLNMLRHPERKVEASLAKESGQYTIAGPFQLVQGGTGALLFDPIYTTGADGSQKYWGFSVLVLDWESFLDEIQINKLQDASYEYLIWKEGHNGERIVIAQGDRPVGPNTLEVACAVPNDTWYFEIRPATGWITPTQETFNVLLLLVLPALATVGYWQFELRRYKDAVHAAELEKAAREAQAANVAKTRFLFNMSHDIRTPMNAIIGYAELLAAHLDDRDRALDYLGKIRSSSDFLLSLINYVLEMARIESGKAALKLEPSDINELAASLKAVFDPLADEKHITTTCTIDIQHPYVRSDQTKVREIFLNIISNAIKYTPEGGRVDFTMTELPGETPSTVRYKAVVQDDGIGMSAEYLPHLFEEFSREHTSTESRVTGTGLGLPIVKSLVQLMGGTIDVESTVGKGSTFTVIIPFPVISKEELTQQREQPADPAAGLVGKHLLLAEDNDLNAEIALTILQENGIIVNRAEDGIRCLELLGAKPAGYYDAVLMDIQMPRMDGYQAAQAIRALPDARSTVPIIAMTANAFEEDKQRAFDAGMNDHIPKPISLNALLAALRKNLK